MEQFKDFWKPLHHPQLRLKSIFVKKFQNTASWSAGESKCVTIEDVSIVWYMETKHIWNDLDIFSLCVQQEKVRKNGGAVGTRLPNEPEIELYCAQKQKNLFVWRN